MQVVQEMRRLAAGTRDVILLRGRQICPVDSLVASRGFFWFGVTEIIPVAHQLIDSVTASTWDFQHYSEVSGDIWTPGDQLPGTGVTAMCVCVMMACVTSSLYWYLWSERSDLWHRTRDATTGVHVMFQTMPMVNVMFSQSLICCFKNHRTRNITALSILCGCFPNGLSSAGHWRALWW